MTKNSLKPEEVQLAEIESLRKKALEKELEQIRDKLPIKQKTKNLVEASLRDKTVTKQDMFQAKGVKSAGVTAGYIATETATDETFILKQFYKLNKDVNTPQEKQNRIDGVQEFIGATMYQFLLYDRAPQEQLVTPDKENSKSIFVRSKFFKNVEPLSVFSGGGVHGHLGAKSAGFREDSPKLKKLKNIKGFEKVIAACQLMGEKDYHAANMMVQEDGTVTKIDHGKSFYDFNKDFSSMVKSTNEKFKRFGYSEEIQKGNLDFDVEKYSKSLNQMVSQLSEDQIDKIVDQRVAELQKAGLNPEGLLAAPQFSLDEARRKISINNFNDLRNTYKEITKENFQNMNEIAKQVEIVAKFSDVSPEFKKGGWLKALAESPEKDPIKYAINHNIKIDGIDARQYAVTKTINEYLQEKDPVKKLELEKQYKVVAKELEEDKSFNKGEKNAKQYVLEKIIDEYLNTDKPASQKALNEKYESVQKLGEKEAPQLLSKDSNLGRFLNNPKASEIMANHIAFKDKTTIADIDYTKCDLDLIKKCKEVCEKTSKARDYDRLSTIQKVGVAFATVIPVIGNAVAYYAMKSHNQAEKAKLETEIGQPLDLIRKDLESLSKKPKQFAPKPELTPMLNKIRKSLSSYVPTTNSNGKSHPTPLNTTKKLEISSGRST